MALVSKCNTTNILKHFFFLEKGHFTALNLIQLTCGQECVLGAKLCVMTHMCERANLTMGS